MLILPVLFAITGPNLAAIELVELLQANNIAAPSEEDCNFLQAAVDSFLKVAIVPQPASFVPSQEDAYVLWAQVLPKRCAWQRDDGVITSCPEDSPLYNSDSSTCSIWNATHSLLDGNGMLQFSTDDIGAEFANELEIRKGGIQRICREGSGFSPCGILEREDMLFPDYSVTVFYNENPTISLV